MERTHLKEKIRQIPHGPGVYLMKDRLGHILYVGKAKNLKKRVSSYFQGARKFDTQPKIAAMVELVHDVDIWEVKSETEAILLEGQFIKKYKPKYNTEFTDDKRFLLVRVNLKNTIAQFRLCRIRKNDTATYFGPFAHASLLKKTLQQMRLKFGILLGDVHPKKLPNGHYRLYDDMRAEIYQHPNEVSAEEYKKRVERACEFLTGKEKVWLEKLKEDMQKAAASKNYEKAANLRDTLFAIEQTTSKKRKFTHAKYEPASSPHTLKQLKELLKLPESPSIIECFDISHISGNFTVASMVHFKDGRSHPKEYRCYKIRSFTGNDDYQAMEEVVSRRYARLHNENKPLPNLIVIDGGRGQVHAAIKSFLFLDIKPPPIIGLAKRKETIIVPGQKEGINLPANHPVLHLLQQLRDEAHRFANTFNAKLRSKKLKNLF